jgi:aryl-alcohol dehydrogenase-like predicted oxidoreductase
VTSALIGVSSPEQVADSVKALDSLWRQSAGLGA